MGIETNLDKVFVNQLNYLISELSHFSCFDLIIEKEKTKQSILHNTIIIAKAQYAPYTFVNMILNLKAE